MKTLIKYISAIIGGTAILSCTDYSEHVSYNEQYPLPEGKELYRPLEYSGQDWRVDTFAYCYNRMACTDNLAIFWEKGFGDDLANPPQLEGNDMHVDLENLKNKLEQFYTFYRDDLNFVNEGSLSERYRMMVMIQYSLEGTAYGGTYDNTIGAFWAAPNRLQDENLNTVAHELGHSFQLQMIADGSSCWGDGQGAGFYEMTSQWMLWQVNPNWIAEEQYHWDAFKQAMHKAFLHEENIYRSPYVLEYWSEKNGQTFIADMYRQSLSYEDPVQTYQRMKGYQAGENYKFVDEMFDCYCHLVNLDFERVYDETRAFANSFENFSPYMDIQDDGYYQVKAERCPENYGFNVIKLSVPEAGTTVTADFKGLQGEDVAPNGCLGYDNAWYYIPYYRYGFVGVTEDGETVLGTSGSTDYYNQTSTASWTVPSDQKLAYLWLVVTAGPSTDHWTLSALPMAQWPYKVKLTNTSIQ